MIWSLKVLRSQHSPSATAPWVRNIYFLSGSTAAAENCDAASRRSLIGSHSQNSDQPKEAVSDGRAPLITVQSTDKLASETILRKEEALHYKLYF